MRGDDERRREKKRKRGLGRLLHFIVSESTQILLGSLHRFGIKSSLQLSAKIGRSHLNPLMHGKHLTTTHSRSHSLAHWTGTLHVPENYTTLAEARIVLLMPTCGPS